MAPGRRLCLSLFALLLTLTVGAIPARADAIGPGFDLFATTSGTTVCLTGIGCIQMVGKPIGPFNTDTIVQRMSGISPFNVGDTGTIPIELVALSLQSVQPVQMGSNFFNVTVTLTPNTVSSGQMTVNHNGANGGTFDSFFDVFFDITLTDIQNPQNTQTQSISDRITGSGTWSHTPPPNYPFDPRFPSGGFYPGALSEGGTNFSLVHNVTPAQTPEPGTLTLFGAGLAGVAMRLRRKLRG